MDKETRAARSREAILDAALRLFAERGYEATSLQDVGAAAGLSRGSPGYFFGSKEDLYRAVLERGLGQVRTAVRTGRERALASQEPPPVVLAGVVGEYFDFLCDHPDFVRLIEWEALSGGRQIGSLPPHLEAAQEALGAIISELALEPGQAGQARQLLLSLIGLCWFPLVHGPTVLRALGGDMSDPAFREERRQHVIALVLQGVQGQIGPPANCSSDGVVP
jgi:AcrR family transcriptional regulator